MEPVIGRTNKKESILRFALSFFLLAGLLVGTAQAQDVRYVSDKQYVALRSGAGNNNPVTERGLPSGTRLVVKRLSDDGSWAEVTTDTGASGWIGTQYLMSEEPARERLDAMLQKAQQAGGLSEAMQQELQQLQAERDQLLAQVAADEAQLQTVGEELTQLKQISGNAEQLDADNRRLVVDSEQLRSELDMLEAENQRLRDKVESEDFLNGALAVLLGVIITLVVPRLWPKPRRSSSWA
jgi:SH3 domain protein